MRIEILNTLMNLSAGLLIGSYGSIMYRYEMITIGFLGVLTIPAVKFFLKNKKKQGLVLTIHTAYEKTWENHIINVADGTFIAKFPDSYQPYNHGSNKKSAPGLYVIRNRKIIGVIDRKGKWVIRPDIYTRLGMRCAFFDARKEEKLETLILSFNGKKVDQY